MPLTAKGKKIYARMTSARSQGGYGQVEGARVFYASKNSGRIKGVEGKRRRRARTVITY